MNSRILVLPSINADGRRTAQFERSQYGNNWMESGKADPRSVIWKAAVAIMTYTGRVLSAYFKSMVAT